MHNAYQKLEVSTGKGTTLSVLCLPSSDVVEVNGIEPMTSCVQGRRSPN